MEVQASLVDRVSCANMQIQVHQGNSACSDKIFFEIGSVWGKEQISSR